MEDHSDILELLDRRDQEFKGWKWKPERSFDFVFVRRRIREIVEELVDEVEELDLRGLPDSGELRRKQRKVRWA